MKNQYYLIDGGQATAAEGAEQWPNICEHMSTNTRTPTLSRTLTYTQRQCEFNLMLLLPFYVVLFLLIFIYLLLFSFCSQTKKIFCFSQKLHHCLLRWVSVERHPIPSGKSAGDHKNKCLMSNHLFYYQRRRAPILCIFRLLLLMLLLRFQQFKTFIFQSDN